MISQTAARRRLDTLQLQISERLRRERMVSARAITDAWLDGVSDEDLSLFDGALERAETGMPWAAACADAYADLSEADRARWDALFVDLAAAYRAAGVSEDDVRRAAADIEADRGGTARREL